MQTHAASTDQDPHSQSVLGQHSINPNNKPRPFSRLMGVTGKHLHLKTESFGPNNCLNSFMGSTSLHPNPLQKDQQQDWAGQVGTEVLSRAKGTIFTSCNPPTKPSHHHSIKPYTASRHWSRYFISQLCTYHLTLRNITFKRWFLKAKFGILLYLWARLADLRKNKVVLFSFDIHRTIFEREWGHKKRILGALATWCMSAEVRLVSPGSKGRCNSLHKTAEWNSIDHPYQGGKIPFKRLRSSPSTGEAIRSEDKWKSQSFSWVKRNHAHSSPLG